jgi:ribose transport system substrate-binding protein
VSLITPVIPFEGRTLIGKRVKKIKGARSCVLAVALVGAACGRDRQHQPQIGVALPVDSDALAQQLRRGMQPAADSLGFELVVVGAGDAAAHQAAQVDSLVARRVAAVLIDPLPGSGVTAAIERARRASVPVFTVIDRGDGDQIVSHIGSDDRMGGELVGAYVARRLQGGGNIVILDRPGVAAAREHVAGLRLALSRSPNIRIVAMPAVEPASRAAARQKTATLFASDQRIDAVVGTSDELALGALEAIRAAGAREAFIVGVGADPEALAAIRDGSALVADVMRDPLTIGRYAVLVAASHLRGNRVAPLVPVRMRLVDRDSL